MHQTTVTHIHLGRFHQSLARVDTPWPQAAHQLQADLQIDVALQSGAADAQATCQAALLQKCALLMGQHGPQPAHGFSGQASGEHGHIALQVASHKVLAPAQAGGLIGGQQTVWKTAAQPEGVQVCRCPFQGLNWPQIHIGHAPSQWFTALLHQVQRGRTQQQKMVFKEDGSRGKGALMTGNLALQIGGCFRPLRRSAALIKPDAFVCVSHDFKVMREAWQKPWR
jgi:hypothetical protein